VSSKYLLVVSCGIVFFFSNKRSVYCMCGGCRVYVLVIRNVCGMYVWQVFCANFMYVCTDA